MQFVHGVARTHAASAAEASADSLLGYVSSNLVAPINSYTPERTHICLLGQGVALLR